MASSDVAGKVVGNNPFDDACLFEYCKPQLYGVAVQEIVGRGRGYIAMRNMRMGEIVFEAKHVAFQCKQENASVEQAATGFAYGLLRNPNTRQVPLSILCSNPTMETDFASWMTPDSNMLRDEVQVSREQWFRAIAAVRINSWGEMSDTDGVLNGRTLYLNIFGSLFNHSCASNAYLDGQADRPDKVMLIRDVKEGEEVTVAYPSDKILLRPTEFRQKSLRTSWGFTCTCERCAPLRSTEEDKLMTTTIDKTIHDKVEAILNKSTLSQDDSLEVQRVIKNIRKCKLMDWRAHAIRQRLLNLKIDRDCSLGRVIASHFKIWLSECIKMQKQFLAPASLYKEQEYNTCMVLGTYYGYTQQTIFETMASADPWFASDDFVRIYNPNPSPKTFLEPIVRRS